MNKMEYSFLSVLIIVNFHYEKIILMDLFFSLLLSTVINIFYSNTDKNCKQKT